MAKLCVNTPARVSSWAVAKIPGTPQVAIKFNDLRPVAMSAEEAREFVAAIDSELGEPDLPLASKRLRVA
jgi:hypothetical protein